jgi:capsular exopolysaccharide synthesis family protein
MKIPETERSLIGIQRSFKINNDIYTFLLQKRAESAIAKASNMPDSQIIDDARAMNTNPISPKKTSLYLISLIIGLIFPIVVIIIRKNIYDYVESKSDVSSISDIPIISSIPHSDHEVTSVVNDFPKSDISEAFRGLRTKLKFILNNTNNNTLLITSSIPAEGKTFLAVNIAIGYAITNKKTIILGVDLRKPRLTKVFDSDSPFGVSTYLSGQSTIAESIMKTHIDNLDYFPAGPIPPNPSELIGNEKMGALIEQLKTNYEYIIIDSPPINIVSDAIQLFPLVDTILYVVRLNYTRKRFLDDVNLLFTTKKVKNIGLVINDDLMNDRYGYRYKYGYKYKYNYYYEENKTKKNKNKLLSLFKKSK